MPILWRVRAIVCFLLAVSTAIGAVVPAHACACAAPSRTPATPENQRVAAPQSAAKSCCQSAAKKQACCAPTTICGTGTKSSCCGDKARADRPGKLPTTSLPPDAPGCHCLRCECEVPPAPSAPAPTAPVATDFDDH